MRKICLYGAGGHSYAVVELIRSCGNYEPVLILDDAPGLDEILGVPVKQFSESLLLQDVCLTLGDNRIRKMKAEQYKANYPVFIHQSAVKYPSASIGEGSVILPGAILDADVQIGKHVVVNNHATLSHNVVVGDYSHIAIQAAVAGKVTIGEGALIGAGSVILPGVNIGSWAVIGAGAVITRDVPDHATVVGNPGEVIRINKDGHE